MNFDFGVFDHLDTHKDVPPAQIHED